MAESPGSENTIDPLWVSGVFTRIVSFNCSAEVGVYGGGDEPVVGESRPKGLFPVFWRIVSYAEASTSVGMRWWVLGGLPEEGDNVTDILRLLLGNGDGVFRCNGTMRLVLLSEGNAVSARFGRES